MPETELSDQFRLSGAWNFRDVGGARTIDGRVVRGGALFRSSELSRLDSLGNEQLTWLGIRHVFDLRGESEVARSGRDSVLPGVEVRNLPYEIHKGERAPHEVGVMDFEAQRSYMLRAYTSFPSLPGAKTAIRAVVAALTAGDGGVLVHCAAGKDRAGWTVATVLRAAGVREEDILADYLASNDAVKPLRDHLAAVWAPAADGEPVSLSDAVLGVTEEYYRHGIAVVNELYGSFDGYLDALDLGENAIEMLKSALTDSTD